jgi:hypothetical protein
MGMTYDAARGQVVLFGGFSGSQEFNDTWTWDGTDWTPRSPAHAPYYRHGVGMTYDAARGQVVLFGGGFNGTLFNDTWTWDGTDWTQRSPAHAPSARYSLGMTYDAARGQVVLFWVVDLNYYYLLRGDTWTWDGTDWTRRTPAHAPSGRADLSLAYDAARAQVVLFGGGDLDSQLGDAWTWDGTDWAVPFRASIDLTPSSGPPGTVVQVDGRNFGAHQKVRLLFIDSTLGTEKLGTVTTDGTGAFTTQVTIPSDATLGDQQIKAWGHHSGQFRFRAFTVT